MSRQLDVAIAEALGYEVEREFRKKEGYAGHRSDLLYEWKVRQFDGGGYRWYGLSYYSTDGNAMLELDREMQVRGYILYLTNDDKGWGAKYEKPEHYSNWFYIPREGLSEPFARALAAYKALTGKEWEDE